MVDPDQVKLENTSRHVLGADTYLQNKAAALALRLQRDFPQSRATGHSCEWQKLAAEQSEIFQKVDLAISTIGSWSHEAELNARQIKLGNPATTLYAWTEPHAAAGHAVLIGTAGGCLACGLSKTGEALFRAAVFDSPTLRREAACGHHFQPYGAAEITVIAGMAADLALDYLLGRAASGAHRVVSGREAAVTRAGGAWSADWRAATQDRPSATMVECFWRHDLACSVCHNSGR